MTLPLVRKILPEAMRNRVTKNPNPLTNLIVGDCKWRRYPERTPQARQLYDIARETRLHAPVRNGGAELLCRRLLLAVEDHLDADHETTAADVANDGVLLLELRFIIVSIRSHSCVMEMSV